MWILQAPGLEFEGLNYTAEYDIVMAMITVCWVMWRTFIKVILSITSLDYVDMGICIQL